jgi:hypothetical protein
MALKLIGKIVLFLLPIAIIMGFPIWVAYRTGEFMSDDAIVAAQASTSTTVLVGLSLSDPIAYVNLKSVIARDPKILVLGASRVESIRADFFTDPSEVFVAAQTIQKISHFRHFIDKIPANETPKLLIVDMEPKFFDPNYDNLQPDNIDDLLTQPVPSSDVLSNWPLIYWYFFKKDFSIGQILNAQNGDIGLAAVMRGAGYRNDGSYDPGTTLYATNDTTMANIEQGGPGFEYADTVSQGALNELDAFLADCKARGISVIGFIPPFSPQVYATLESMPKQYGYMPLLMPSLMPIFQKYQDGLYDFSNPGPLGITAKEMQDGLHSTERGSLIFFAKMALEDPVLRQYTDPPLLEAQLQATSSEENLFGH